MEHECFQDYVPQQSQFLLCKLYRTTEKSDKPTNLKVRNSSLKSLGRYTSIPVFVWRGEWFAFCWIEYPLAPSFLLDEPSTIEILCITCTLNNKWVRSFTLWYRIKTCILSFSIFFLFCSCLVYNFIAIQLTFGCVFFVIVCSIS